MGVQVAVPPPQELYPEGDYLLTVSGNSDVPENPNKVKVIFTFAQGALVGKTVARKFNRTLGPQSHLREFLAVLGINVDGMQPGQKLDLDILRGMQVFARLSHFPYQGRVVNSLGNWRRAMGGAIPQPQPQAVQPGAVPAAFQAPVLAPQPFVPAPAPAVIPAPVPQAAPYTAPPVQPAPVGPRLTF